MLGRCISNSLCTLARCTHHFLKCTRVVCVVCVCDRWATLLASVVMVASVLRPWAHVTVREEGRKREMDGDGG
jgi:hypothetical protein